MGDVSGVDLVRSFLAQRGLDARILELDKSTRSSALAAQALGCTVAEIAKSVVFCGIETAVVVISGDQRVDPDKLGVAVGRQLRIASPDEVRHRTGYEIGGVPPFPHRPEVLVFPDLTLTRFQHVWTAAGAQNAVMKVSSTELIAATARPAIDLALA